MKKFNVDRWVKQEAAKHETAASIQARITSELQTLELAKKYNISEDATGHLELLNVLKAKLEKVNT